MLVLCSQNAFLYVFVFLFLLLLLFCKNIHFYINNKSGNVQYALLWMCACALPEQVDCEEDEDDEKERNDKSSW